MPVENYADKVICLAFVPFSGPPNGSDSFNVNIIFRQGYLQPQPFVVDRAEEVIIDLKSWVFLGPSVRTAKIRKHIKPVFVLKKLANVVNSFTGGRDRRFAQRVFDIQNPGRVMSF